MIKWDRYERLPIPTEDSRRRSLEKKVPAQVKTRQGWRYKTEKLMTKYNYNRTSIGKTSPLWSKNNITLERVKLDKKKSEYTEEELHQKT